MPKIARVDTHTQTILNMGWLLKISGLSDET
jgi:hypothetical protein